MPEIEPATQARLEQERNAWLATVRPDGRPHLVPVWFVWRRGRLYLRIQPTSVKAVNLRRNDRVAFSLEDGSRPLICQGNARIIDGATPAAVAELFRAKYEWELGDETEYTTLVEITPRKWLSWGEPEDGEAPG